MASPNPEPPVEHTLPRLLGDALAVVVDTQHGHAGIVPERDIDQAATMPGSSLKEADVRGGPQSLPFRFR